ncbi:MAG: Ribonuclease HII [Candidatus Moranbacteria bacterium GW2011_GWF2_34_56]|nr:MAG: Ribonuclease HII [Candidatus Moranbacteria bacterium GW2011_GWF1_34_10]KKP64800.1 MAG: Ribonuclease HII [Candidatus Moranbacteria bacterium GW2011_GWF2_34_56]
MPSMKNKVIIESTFEVEKSLLGKDYDFIIGVDEAGRGPLAGPVVAAAVVLRNSKIPNSKFKINSNDQLTPPQSSPWEGEEDVFMESCQEGEERMWDLIKDSKKLSEKRREEVFDFIHKNFYVGVGICNHETIDRVNILEATFLAMKKAVGELKKQIKNQGEKMIILVDGDKIIPNFSCAQKSIVSGDKLVKSISAASIIAKVTRDRMMDEFDKKYPAYQFAKHKGYGTQIHVAALKLNGPCEIHRRTFAPVRNAINDRWKK